MMQGQQVMPHRCACKHHTETLYCPTFAGDGGMACMAFGTDGALSRPAPDARPPELDAATHTSRDCFQVRSDSKSSGAIFVPPDAHAFLVQVFRVLPARVQRVSHQRLHICRAGAVMHLPVHHFWSAKGELDRPRWPRVLRGHVELLPRVLVPLRRRYPVRPAGRVQKFGSR